jgi:cyclophilin family peptidyl-prolyl cis-trans isomerase
MDRQNTNGSQFFITLIGIGRLYDPPGQIPPVPSPATAEYNQLVQSLQDARASRQQVHLFGKVIRMDVVNKSPRDPSTDPERRRVT